jgi:hypothetical protein
MGENWEMGENWGMGEMGDLFLFLLKDSFPELGESS